MRLSEHCASSLSFPHSVASGWPDVEDVDGRGVFLNPVDDPVDVGFFSVHQMPQCAVFGR